MAKSVHQSIADLFITTLASDSTGAMSRREAQFYQTDPTAWFVDKLGVREETIIWSLNPGYQKHAWDGTKDPLHKVLLNLADNKNVGVESATGTGKTFLAAGVTMWFLTSWENAIIVTCAPKEAQLTLHMWKEISRNWGQFKLAYPKATYSKLRLRMKPPIVGEENAPPSEVWAAVGFGVGVGAEEQSATKAQGFHAEHMLIISEETAGQHPAVMTAFANTCVGDHNLMLALGNPDNEHDQLHKFCISSGTEHIRISAHDHPNVVCDNPKIVPGAVTMKSLLKRKEDYGEDSILYKSRGRGICPSESSDALIRRIWLDNAFAKRTDLKLLEVYRRNSSPALGVDVANSPNGDKAAVARGEGAIFHEVLSKQCPDANEYGRETVMPLMHQYRISPRNVGVDTVGVGVGCYNELKRLKLEPVPLNGGNTVEPVGEEKFGNLRCQMWWQARVDLEKGNIIIMEYDEELFMDLLTPTWKTKGGKIWVESKEEFKKRLGRSPDKGDAFVYWNWVRVQRAGATKGGSLVTL